MSSLVVNIRGVSFFSGEVHEKVPAVLRHIAHSERMLSVVPASRLEARPRPEMFSTGIPELDALTAGIPRGCLTEIWGTGSSGKSSVLLAAVAAATRREEICVLVDASDSFDPASGAAAGVDLARLLWVRCGASPDSAGSRARRKAAVSRGEHRLEQVLKVTDLILQGGGFGLVALDLAGIPEKFVRRIPLASWFRFQRAVEHTKTALLVISETPCAQTCAALALRVEQLSAISSQSFEKPWHVVVLEKLQVEAEIVRSRLERKPVRSEKVNFETQTVIAG